MTELTEEQNEELRNIFDEIEKQVIQQRKEATNQAHIEILDMIDSKLDKYRVKK